MASIPGVGVVLPHEIWIKIFKHLTTSDIINLCSVSPDHKYFLKEKDVVKYFDIGGDYNFSNVHLNSFFHENVEYRYIKTLNINKMYWIPLKDLRNLISQLPNLVELFAMDTRLALRDKDVRLYGMLKTLALTVTYREFDAEPVLYRNNLYLLKKFCLSIALKQEYFSSLYKLFNELVGLQELWINDTDDSVIEPIKYDYIVFKLKFLKKLVIKSKVNIPFLDYKPFGFAKFFETRRFQSIIMCYEHYPPETIVPYRKISLFEPFETDLERAWDVIRKFQCEMPYGSKCAQKFYVTKQIKDIEFDELNFFHSRCFCNPSFIKATLDFLTAKNSRNLQKLCIKTCILQRHSTSKDHSIVNLQERKYPIIDVIENCKNLKTLELMSCNNCDYETNNIKEPTCNVTILDAYAFISNWVELERLTLEVAVHIHGKFLKEILMLCPKLKYLRIISYSTNENLNMNVYQALPYGSALEEFCFENKNINIKRIFLGLGELNTCKLRRICLNAKYSESVDFKPIQQFLHKNDQLIFLYIAIANQSKTELDALQEVLDSVKRHNAVNRDLKIFFAKKTVHHFSGTYPVPSVHRQFMAYDTEVSNVDFNNFR